MRFKDNSYWNKARGRGKIEAYTPPIGNFSFDIQTTAANELYDSYLYVASGGTMAINWGDGNEETITTVDYVTHTYAVAGTYTVEISELVDCYIDFGGDTWVVSINTAFPSSFDFTNTEVTFGSFAKGATNLVSVPSKLFYNVSQYIDSSTFDDFFNGCVSLESIPGDLLEVDWSSYSSTHYYFNDFATGCTSLTTVGEGLFSHVDTTTPPYMYTNDAFSGCTALISAEIPFITSGNQHILAQRMYLNCTSLTTIADGMFQNLIDYSDIRQAFKGCTSLTTTPNSIIQGSTDGNLNLDGLFTDCTGLTSISSTLFSGNTYIDYLFQTFSGCTSVTSYPTGLMTGMTTLGYILEVFSGCTGMTNACDELWNLFPTADGEDCFLGCVNLSNYASIPTYWK